MRSLIKPAAPLLLFGLLFLAAFESGSPPSDASGAAPPTGQAVDTTVKVFVVWGNSNALGVGQHIEDLTGVSYRPTIPTGRAWEWYWKGATTPTTPRSQPRTPSLG